MHRFPRWLIIIGVFAVSIALIVLGVVFVPQVFGQYTCITFSDYRTSELLLYDTLHNRMIPDTRYMLSTNWLTPINYYLTSTRSSENPLEFSLALEPIEEGEGTPIVLESAVRLPNNGWLSIQSAWSADGWQIAYLTQGDARDYRMTIFNLDDLSKRSESFMLPNGITDTHWLGEWSPDNAYIAIRRLDGTYPYVLTGVWSVENMTFLPITARGSQLVYSAWSPVGERLATFKNSRVEGNELLLLDPEDMENATRIPLTTAGEIQGIDWSPTGDFFVVARLASGLDEAARAYRQWFFDFYGEDGRVLQENVASRALAGSVPRSAGQVTFVQPKVIPGFWSQDGESWIMLRDSVGGNQPETQLSAFDPLTNSFQVLEEHISAELYIPMFQLPSQMVTFAGESIFPDNEYLLLPQRRNGTIAFDYLNLRDHTRFSLLEGAETVLMEAYPYAVPQRLIWAGGDFLIPWRTHGEVHLTALSGENGEKIAEAVGMESLEQINYLSNYWIGFVAVRDGQRRIELLNLETGEHRLVPGEVPEGRIWNGILSPTLEHIALVFSPGRTFTSADRGYLRFVSLENDTSRDIRENVSPIGIWSPSGESYAFFQGTTGLVLQVVNTVGETLVETDLPRRFSTDSLSFRGWSHCERNPEFAGF